MNKSISCSLFLLLLFMPVVLLQAQQASSVGNQASRLQPKIFANGVISTGDYETHAAFSPTGDTVFYLKCAADLNICAICISKKQQGKWSVPEIISFSGKYVDVDPFMTKDGNTLYFVSNRPLTKNGPVKEDWDIWKVERNGTDWSEPIHLDSPVNSIASEYYPNIADNGDLYFSSGRKGGAGGSDIYRARLINGKYSQVENLGAPINSGYNEYEPFIAPDGSYLIYMATQPDGLANADLFISYHKNGKWTAPRKLPEPINSSATEWAPRVTRDGKYFFFGSTRGKVNGVLPQRENLQQLQTRLRSSGNGLSDIYFTDLSPLLASTPPSTNNNNETTMHTNDPQQQDLKALSKLNAQFIANFIAGDTNAHNQIIHHNFVCIENAGTIVHREQYMIDWGHAYAQGGFTSFSYSDEDIRLFDDMALVRSRTTYTKMVDGRSVTGHSVYTDTYIKENGRWWCVQAHITPVRQ